MIWEEVYIKNKNLFFKGKNFIKENNSLKIIMIVFILILKNLVFSHLG